VDLALSAARNKSASGSNHHLPTRGWARSFERIYRSDELFRRMVHSPKPNVKASPGASEAPQTMRRSPWLALTSRPDTRHAEFSSPHDGQWLLPMQAFGWPACPRSNEHLLRSREQLRFTVVSTPGRHSGVSVESP